jgi:hypothetical protein
MYFAPLGTVIVGAVAAIRVTSLAGNVLRRALVIMFFVVGSYFLLCSRLSYFKEWKFDADAKSLYSVLAYYNHNYGVTTIGTSWMFSSSLTFYSVFSGRESFADFMGESPYPADKQVYVLHYPEDDQFIKTNDLKIVYKGDLSDAVVAIRPELEATEWRRP